MSELFIKQMELGPMENFVYLIGDPQTRQAVVVDPAWQVDSVLKIADTAEYKIIGALVSHHHYDHTNGLEELLSSHDIPIYVHREDVPYLKIGTSSVVKSSHGDEITLGSVRIRLLHTPGHTPGSQCFHVHNHLVSGDTLFIQGCGRCDLPGGDAEAMYYTLTQKLMRMPEDTVLLPGHNYAPVPSITLGEAKIHNPYLKTAATSLKDFLRLRMGR